MIQDYGKRARIWDLVALILHDVIEDHPERWREIYEKFSIHIFRDVLILSKISMKTRKEILECVIKNNDVHKSIVGNILQILDPNDPMIKLWRFSHYAQDPLGQDTQKFQMAIWLYKQEILDKYQDKDEAEDEYISLGNYLHFTKDDAKRKLQDMLNNMSDMEDMEKKKPWYIERRRIKAYILWVKLRNFWLKDEYSRLQWAFKKAGYMMYTDAEVLTKTKNKK